MNDYDKSVANVLTTQRAFYATANKLALRSYLDERTAAMEDAERTALKTRIIISPEQQRLREQILGQLSDFSRMLLTVALAKDAEEFRARAKRTGELAGKVADMLKQTTATIAMVVPPGSGQANVIVVKEALEYGVVVVGEMGKFFIEASAERGLDKTLTRNTMGNINYILSFLRYDIIACAIRLQTFEEGESSRVMVEVKQYTKYLSSLRGRWVSSRDKSFLEARAGVTGNRDEAVDAMMWLLMTQAEPATDGLKALTDMNDALVVYAASKQTSADQDALKARTKVFLAASTAAVDSLKHYESEETDIPPDKQ